MKAILKKTFLLSTTSSLFLTQQLSSVNIDVEMQKDKKISFEIDSYDAIDQLLEQVDGYLKEDKFCKVTLVSLNDAEEGELASRFVDHRDYHAPVPETAIKDMRYIITILGNKPLLKLKQYKKNLSDAGDRLIDVHPLHFWKQIFTDEKMTSDIHNIRRRTKVWKSFMKGMAKSLQEAADGNNLKQEYLEDFSFKVGIDISLINESVTQNDWNTFVQQLLTHVPRKGNINRYDQ